jgi:hypothetical protein
VLAVWGRVPAHPAARPSGRIDRRPPAKPTQWGASCAMERACGRAWIRTICGKVSCTEKRGTWKNLHAARVGQPCDKVSARGKRHHPCIGQKAGLIHRESFGASVLHHSEIQAVVRSIAENECRLTRPSLLSTATHVHDFSFFFFSSLSGKGLTRLIRSMILSATFLQASFPSQAVTFPDARTRLVAVCTILYW